MNATSRVTWIFVFATGCSVTTHPTEVATLGQAASMATMEANMRAPGRVVVERVTAANWAVSLSGLLNLDHPKAEGAGIEDREEPIEIYFYAIHHPKHGTFIVDTGVAKEFRTPDETFVGGLVASAMNLEKLEVLTDTATWIEAQPKPIAGVFLTHLHLDHIMGLTDVPRGTPIYVGPGEAEASQFLYMFVQGTTDRALEGHAPLNTWATAADEAAVIDVFSDGSVFAIHVPGHTPGSMAFVAVTNDGPVLIVGDTSHTVWGWQNGVEPGSFTADHEANAKSLVMLRDLAGRHPRITVYIGHQHLAAETTLADR